MISPHVVTIMFNQDVQYTWDADFLDLINAGPSPSSLFYGDFVLHTNNASANSRAPKLPLIYHLAHLKSIIF